MTRLFVLFFAAGIAHGAEIPAGSMPEIDGRWAEKEWESAHSIKLPGGEARLRTAGRTVCLAVRFDRPYTGERIDFSVATRSGSIFSTHSLHPAVYLPQLPFFPMPSVMKRQGSWAKRQRIGFREPYAARFRAHVLQKDEKSWTAEFAVAHEALNLPAKEDAVFEIRVVRAFSKEDQPTDKAPETWQSLQLTLDATAALYETPADDADNKQALQLFKEGATLPMLERKFALDAVDELLDSCSKETFHGLWFRTHLLRRSNRLAEARGTLRSLLQRMPGARALKPVISERRQLLVLNHDYASLREQESAGWIDTVEAAWAREKAMRAQDKDLPRVVIETSAGPVTIELFARDAPALSKSIQTWIGAGKAKQLEAAWATGGVGFAFAGPTPPKEAKPSGRRAWRGTLAFIHEKGGELRLLLTTGHVHLYRSASAIGRIVAGQEVVDRLGVSDSIVSARAP
ncbi:MAG: hypothetical protein ACYS0E_01295 [Planctomycetota bacterium]|jgi:hypothetical protein